MRTHQISVGIYQRHLQLYRFLNDTYIFTSLIRPDLKKHIDKFSLSTSKAKKPYRVPKKNSFIDSKRRDKDIQILLQHQYDSGIYESLIISIISRVEAFLIECVEIAILSYPDKLKLLLDDKSGIPLDLFIGGSDKETILAEMIRKRSEALTFLSPKKYIERLEQILSIKIDGDIAEQFIEAKASRDIIVHGTGIINTTYLDKAGAIARGQLSERLLIDKDYFRSIVVNAKRLSGDIAHKTEERFH